MAYKFNPYTSTYVDPGSVKISQDLRQRFVDNFAADDALTESVNNMISLSPDQGAKDVLKEKYTNILDERIAAGDYETMGQSIARDARKFTTEYQPIQEQAMRRQQIEEDLKGRVGAKENGITNQMYEMAMGHMDKKYQNSGGVSEGGAYTGINVPKYVDVLQEVMDAVDDITPDKQGGVTMETTGLGGVEAAGTGLLGQMGLNDVLSEGFRDDLRFSYRTKSGSVEYVDPEQVLGIYDAVLKKPEIQEYLSYDSRMKADAMDEKTLIATLTDSAKAYKADAQRDGVSEDSVRGLNEAAAELENTILRFQSGETDAEGKPLVGIPQLKAAAETSIMMQTLTPIRKAALLEGSYYQEGDSEYSLRVDQAWTNARTAQRENAVPFAGMSGDLQEMVAPGGTNIQSQQRFLEAQQADLQDMKTGVVSEQIQQDLGLTYDDLAGMSVEEFAAREGFDMNDPGQRNRIGLFNRHKTNLLEAEAAVYATEVAIKEVKEASGYNDTAVFNTLMEQTMEGSPEMRELGFGTIGSTVAKLQGALPNVNQETAFRLLMSWAAASNPAEFAGQNNWDGGRNDGKQWLDFAAENPDQAITFVEALTLGSGEPGEQNVLNSSGFKNGLQAARDYVNQDVTDALNVEMQKRTTRQYAPTTYNVIPGMGKSEKAALLDLTNDMSMTSFTFVDPQTGSLVAADELFESWNDLNVDGQRGDPFDVGSATVQGMNFNIANIGPHGGTIEMKIKDKNGNVITGQVPMSQFRNADVQAFTQGDAYRIMRQAANQFGAGINIPIVHLKNNETGKITQISIDFKRKVYKDLSTGKSYDLEGALAPGGELANIGEYNSVVVPRTEL